LRDYDLRSAMRDSETFEDPDIQNINDRIYCTFYNALEVVDNVCELLTAVVILAAIFTIIANLNVTMVLVVLLVMFLNSCITRRQNAQNHEVDKELSPYQRYIGSSLILVLHGAWAAKEVRLFHLKDFFANRLYEKRCEADQISMKSAKNSLNAGIGYSLTGFLQQTFKYIYLIYMVLFCSLTIGSMTIFMSATSRLAGAFDDIVKSYMKMAKRGLEIHELMLFMETPGRQYATGTKEPVFDEHSVFEFRNVSFKYPNADSYAIRHLNLTLPANQRLCIVGSNGSGKSTFLKLLTRLYFPTEGEILLNGVNINEYDYEKYQALFAPVFQDYSLYQLSLRENITFSEEKDNDVEILRLCRECGLLDLIERLPHGLDTSVYKFFDEEGFEPSGGEGQKIAIARALYHNSDVYLLDEPTAALDPVAEYEIYTQFHHLIHNKTAVLITHRLSAVQLADRVAVFHDGHVAEYGTHAQLYAKGGIYTKMFDKQAGFYREAASVKEEDCAFKQVD
ncbi:MAG: ABC transporter ATP-binding protein/permease, partial [Lachnospiraceae bacterium]|nr:ABC transporter ATP-binding protein/permease [Lachnospiraceae bacterium]